MIKDIAQGFVAAAFIFAVVVAAVG